MEGMRSVMRRSLARSLRSLPEADRLEAAWRVAAGQAMAAHGALTGYQDGVLHLLVADPAWMSQMWQMRGYLAAETGRIAGLPVREIHFEGGAGRPGSGAAVPQRFRSGTKHSGR